MSLFLINKQALKSVMAFIFASFLVCEGLMAQKHQQTPPSVQPDTTSGWQLVFSNPSYTFSYLKFFSPELGYAIAGGGGGKYVILKTTNLGLS
jgi:hypothetical protein